MSEALDRVRGISELPLFPLAVVLFPGTPLPLHIFEPRYRQMMTDIRAGHNLFGLSYFDAGASELDLPPVGHIGCAAEVRETQELEDGRSNILTIGVVRYRLEAYAGAGEPYLVGRVSFFEDEAEDAELLAQQAEEVSELFLRIARAVRAINDERAALPELPETTPEHLSFLVAAAMEVEAEVKQDLLELRYTSERLKRLRDLLARAVGSYEERARVHTIAKGNGHRAGS
ncbi:MAG: LON peptidase substrate-binding domain-containing protein [Acidobacteria bacterium]|nr:LON peptidase substrate-binding domain-containing protein [Acidobacteriota bacterium]